MIVVGGSRISSDTLSGQYRNDPVIWQIATMMLDSDARYTYSSMESLDFELVARKEMVRASERLNNSFFSFKVFKDAICNPAYWNRTQEGGFRLKKEANPHEAIRDIIRNSRMYGTECATAIVIVYFLGLVEALPAALFDQLFADIYLMDWKYLDKDMGIQTYRGVKNALPGDCLYFKNPDVNPDTPEWQGENAIMLLNGYYYGHGMGIKKAEGIIRELNRNRARGSQTSAYLMDMIVKPDYQYLARRYLMYQRQNAR